MEEKKSIWPWIALICGIITPLFGLFQLLWSRVSVFHNIINAVDIFQSLILLSGISLLFLPIPLGLISLIIGVHMLLTKNDRKFLMVANILLGIFSIGIYVYLRYFVVPTLPLP